MRQTLFTAAALLGALAGGSQARADVIGFSFGGAAYSGSGLLTYGPDPVTADVPSGAPTVGPDGVRRDPAGAQAITGASGTFSDAALGLFTVAITGVAAVNPSSPTSTNTYAPKSFGWYPVPGVKDTSGATVPGLSYDDLFYPAGSPRTAFDYPFHGGFLDIYGVMFTLADGDVVNVWSDGDMGRGVTYGVAVADATGKLGEQFAGLAASVPEPGSVGLLGAALLGPAVRRRRRGSASAHGS